MSEKWLSSTCKKSKKLDTHKLTASVKRDLQSTLKKCVASLVSLCTRYWKFRKKEISMLSVYSGNDEKFDAYPVTICVKPQICMCQMTHETFLSCVMRKNIASMERKMQPCQNTASRRYRKHLVKKAWKS